MKLAEAIALNAAGKLHRMILTEAGWYCPRRSAAVTASPEPVVEPAPVAVPVSASPQIVKRPRGRPRKVKPPEPVAVMGPAGYYDAQ